MRWGQSVRRLGTQPDFLVAVVVLGIAAVGLNAATQFLQLHFKKQAVPLRMKLTEGFAPEMGNWVLVSKDEPLSPDIEHVLGTDQYINRIYVDRRVVEPDAIGRLKEMSTSEREVALMQVTKRAPDAVMRLHVAYYTGMVDTVAHIPDRCDIADGFDVSNYQTISDGKYGVDAHGNERAISFHYINFDDQTGQGRLSRNVAYFFHVNGHYESDPLAVRRRLQNLLEPYGYYAKMELMIQSPAVLDGVGGERSANDHKVAAMQDFIAAAVPSFESCLPDWDALHQKSVK